MCRCRVVLDAINWLQARDTLNLRSVRPGIGHVSVSNTTPTPMITLNYVIGPMSVSVSVLHRRQEL